MTNNDPQLDPYAASARDLSFGSLDAGVHGNDWDREQLGDEQWSYWQSFTHTDDHGREHILIDGSGVVAALWVEDDLRYYERHEFDEYAESRTYEDGDLFPDALTADEFEALFEVEPFLSSVEGPMMAVWYDCAAIGGDEITAAAKIHNLSLCVVQVEENYGLALTGGGMDMTWDIVAAYVALGQLPPIRFARNLPAMAGAGKSDEDRRSIAACLRSLRAEAENLTREANRLEENAARWAIEGA